MSSSSLLLPALSLQILSGMCRMVPPIQRTTFKFLHMPLTGFPPSQPQSMPFPNHAHNTSGKPQVSQFPKGNLHPPVSWKNSTDSTSLHSKAIIHFDPSSHMPFPPLCLDLFLIQSALLCKYYVPDVCKAV